jgi:cytochrome c oxidase subunit 1
MEVADTCNMVIAISNISFYNSTITLHGLVMIFWLVMPLFINGLGNILIIIAIGNSDVTYPRCNNVSIIIYIITFLFVLQSLILEYGNGLGWTMYPPLSTVLNSISNIEVYCLVNSLIGLGVSSTYTFVNFIVTVVNNKVQGYNYNILLVYVVSIMVVAFLLMLVLPVFSIVLIMLLMDIYTNSMFYDILYGGDAIFYQHLFWIFGHPEVYILIIPSFGVINYILNSVVFKLYSKVSIIYCIICISVIGLIVWAHHMYIVGLDNDTKGYFSAITMVISLPTGCKIFNWFITVISNVNHNVVYGMLTSIPMILVMYFLVLFIVGGTTGVIIGNIIIDICLHDSYYIIIHFHIVLALSIVISLVIMLVEYVVSMSYYFISTNSLLHNSQVINRYTNLLFLLGLMLIFGCMFFIGYNIMPRRVVDYNTYISTWNTVSSIGTLLVMIVLVL